MLRCVTFTMVLFSLPISAWAAIEEDVSDKQRRVDWFQERRLIIESDTANKPTPDDAKKATTEQPLVLRQGADRIYHSDFVELMNDPSLTRDWEFQRNKDWLWWIGSGTAGIPLGGLLFFQNFRGTGPLAPFYDSGRDERANAGDLRSYTLSVSGIAMALYGAYNLGLWISESLDSYHPDRLEPVSIRPRVSEWNELLAAKVNLEPEDWPSPLPPRPSATPTPSPAPGSTSSPAPLPTTPVGGPGTSPYGVDVPTMPTPLPLISPGSFPSPTPGKFGRPGFFQEIGTPADSDS